LQICQSNKNIRNILIKDRAVVGCLGIERDPVEMSAMSIKTGSVSYTAPEIFGEDDYNEKIDIW